MNLSTFLILLHALGVLAFVAFVLMNFWFMMEYFVRATRAGAENPKPRGVTNRQWQKTLPGKTGRRLKVTYFKFLMCSIGIVLGVLYLIMFTRLTS